MKMSRSNPTHIAYSFLGSPHEKSRLITHDALCSRCSNQLRKTQAVSLSDVASNKFTDWDRLLDTGKNALLCLSCAWAYTDLNNRLARLVITHDSVLPLSSAEGSSILFNTQQIQEISIVIPVSGKKHVLPYAEWGNLVHDHGFLPWSGALLNQVAATHYLRSVGVSENAIKDKEMVFLKEANPLRMLIAWETIAEVDPMLHGLMLTMARLLPSEELLNRFEENI